MSLSFAVVSVVAVDGVVVAGMVGWLKYHLSSDWIQCQLQLDHQTSLESDLQPGMKAEVLALSSTALLFGLLAVCRSLFIGCSVQTNSYSYLYSYSYLNLYLYSYLYLHLCVLILVLKLERRGARFVAVH